MKTHLRRLAALLLSACCFTNAAIYAATMASQPWVTNRIAEAEARTDAKITAATNAIPAPVVDLTPATNYTDRALGVFAAIGTVSHALTADSASTADSAMSATWAGRLSSGGSVGMDYFTYEGILAGFAAGTNYTDAVAADIRQNYIPINGAAITDVELFLNQPLYEQGQLRLELPGGGGSVNAASFVSSSQITNHGAVAVATALAASKQDALPYPTNAIPYAAISGAPSGGPEWRVANYDVEVDSIRYVTNGMANLTFLNAGYAYMLFVSTNGWPDGASMFVRGSYSTGATYGVPDVMRLVGYGTWPTNNFQSVWWRSGTNIFVNILLEE